MPGKIKVKILAGRNLPVMDRSGDTTDAYVELKFGNTTFKTDVCRKSLNPQWNSEWYRFEVDDAELQDEPLQIRLMDHDTYSANDAIGKVYINLNPLLLPGVPPTVKNMWTLEAAMNTNTGSQSGSVMTGWIPVYDTMHGIRGEVNIIVKVELFSDFNKFRQSSCGVQFFYSPNIPHGYHTQSVHGFVEELIVSDDPEYKWIDKIRTPRASNEARQTLFFKLSGEVQRKIGLKALDLGGNAVIGYLQNFDLEGESGIVARGIGTAVTLVKSQDILNFPSDNINIEETSFAFFSQSKAHKECTGLDENMPLPQTPTYNPDSNRRDRTNTSKSLRHVKKMVEYPYNASEKDRSPQKSPKLSSLKKSAASYTSLSDSVVQDESIRMMLALEDLRGESNKNRLDMSVKNFKKLFSQIDAETKLSTTPRPSISMKSTSARSSIVSIPSPKKEKVTESATAFLIRSLHSMPLDNVEEDHEIPSTSSALNNANECCDHKQDNLVASNRVNDGNQKNNFDDVIQEMGPKKQTVSRICGSSSEENTSSSDNEFSDEFSNEFSNDSGQYNILHDSNFSIDEELEMNKYIKTLSRAITFPPSKVKLPRSKLQRMDSDTRPLHEGSKVSLVKCLSTNYIFNIESNLMLRDNLQSALQESLVFSKPSKTPPTFNEQVWEKIVRNQQDTHNSQDFNDPLATSTPIESLPPFFPENPNLVTALEDQDESSSTKFLNVNDFPLQKLPEQVFNPENHENLTEVCDKSTEEAILEVRALDYMKNSDTKTPYKNKSVANNPIVMLANIDDEKSDDIFDVDEAEVPISAYALLQNTSDVENTEVKVTLEQIMDKNRLFSSSTDETTHLRETFKQDDASGKLEAEDCSNIFRNSTCSLPSLQQDLYPKTAESNIKKDINLEATMESMLKPASSIESLVQSSSNDIFDTIHKDRQSRMLDLIKIIDTKMMEHTSHHNNNGRVRRRKRDKIHKNLNPANLRNDLKHQVVRRHLQRCVPAEFMRVSSIPKDLSLNESIPHTPDSSSYKSSLESLNTRETLIQSRLRKTAELSCSKRSFLTKRSAIDPIPHEITSKELTVDTQSSDSLRNNSSNIEMKELKPRDTNSLVSSTSVDHIICKSHSICNVKGVLDHDSFTNNTNTANMTYNSCVSRPSPNHRQQDEASLSPSYPLSAVPPVVSKVCQSPSNKAQPAVSLHRRSSDSDLSVTPKGNSLGTSDRSIGGLLRTSTAVVRTMNQDALEMLEYPFITMQQYPPGFIVHIGGLVSSRSVKLLERITNLEEPEGRDAWWKEIRMEVRSHARALACNVVIGYREETSICDDVCVLNAYGTAAVINFHNPTQDADSVFNNKMQSGSVTAPAELDREKNQPKGTFTKLEKSESETIASNIPHQISKSRHMSEGKDHEVFNTQYQTKCNLCHLPYNETSVPFRVNVSKCGICKRAKVPDVMFTTVELPENMTTTGRGCIIQATVCKTKKDLRGELNAKEISDCLPFLEYELHSLLLNKLKVKGMNAIFGLKLQVSVGERLIIGMAVGTAVFLAALQAPSIPQIASGNSWHKEEQLAEIRKTLIETVKKNRDFYRLKPIGDIENGRVATSDTDDSDEELPDLDFNVGTRDTCVLEVDDIEDMDRISLLMDDRPPDDFHVVNTQSIPGLDDLEIVRNLQMFTQISRAKIPAGQSASMPSKYFARLLQSVYFKLRRMVPCALCDMQFKLALPEPDEIQFTVIGMALGLGEPIKINKFQKKAISHTVNKDPVKKIDDSDMIFSLDVDHTDISSDHSSNTVIVNPSTLSTMGPKLRQRSPLRLKTHTTHRHKHVPLKGRYGVDITPLSYLPGGRIERYLGNLNFFFIRESTSIRENGGLSGFTHSFVMEVLAIVRAHITALGGNAMVAFFMTKCVLFHSPHKNQGQCLINVGGDVVCVSYYADEKHSGIPNC